MMQIGFREFSGEGDKQAMVFLVRTCTDSALHFEDLPYRLSSWALDDPDNVGLWTDAEEQLVGWVVLQTPFWTIDYVCHPGMDEVLHRKILAWADKRAQALAGAASGRTTWFVNIFAGQTNRIRDLEEAEFMSQEHVGNDSGAKVLLQRSAQQPVVVSSLPEGFKLRSLAGEAEVEDYVLLHRVVFDSKNMTAAWRKRTLRHPNHRIGLDLVVVAPDGRLAAFCVAWLGKNLGGTLRGRIEPLGVHPDFRRMGLGRAILLEALQRLYLYGANDVYVEADKDHNAAMALYQAVGFRVVRDMLVYRKDYDNH